MPRGPSVERRPGRFPGAIAVRAFPPAARAAPARGDPIPARRVTSFLSSRRRIMLSATPIANRCVVGRMFAMSREFAFLFDLDGTLVDSVYQHVLAWKTALRAENIDLSVWRIHRRVGMSGGLFTEILLRETRLDLTPELHERLRARHAEAYRALGDDVTPLPGALELLTHLRRNAIPWAIATSGRIETAKINLDALGVDTSEVPVVTRDQVKYAKPDPDLFLEAARRLGVSIETCFVVGDAIWDMLAARRARALGVGLLSGGYGADELERAGAMRVFEDPADLLARIDEIGARV
jgi:HAD superfamily hydrolase (TIGR01549 family)